MYIRSKVNLVAGLRGIFVSTLVAFTSSVAAQVPVWVGNSSDDYLGKQLAFEIREGVRRSAGMALADRRQDGRIYLRLTTLDPDDNNRQTVYSATFTVQTYHDIPLEMYLTSLAGACGRSRIAECARNLVAAADEHATDLKRMLRDVQDTERKRK